ncbi:MAG: response regulator transcription factor [Nitrosomonas sp.]|jgi:DNA-binding NarL/FixJ family response regulator|uniref:response regulator n=1 Tax=Nitrosomonas sp. TaxID=42353 RepID=UPI002718AF0F|nr:response regulator transcription factor [Nitrosomonas sp.]MBK6958631.1 response regulator transcription factor [Nitrosomonas sp.]MDO8894633.1 response regulator transcription factor [Nitrosomonas sp.]MDO9469508.1 response regulator transcription factor [Nitrosomonas sp.]MDP1551200.1 response regulator transcription factor [Nitrosomonas sp.]MDP1788506.1 response regulator transcription factor [Nitrosomonas sp.]
MSTVKAKVMLIDDHAMLRHGMAMLINMEPDMEVFAEAGDGNEALAILKKTGPVDIVLLDVTLKTVSGFEVIKSMHALIPTLPVLFISMHDESVYAERALRAGARGYVMKQEPGEVLLTAIREVLKGNVYLSKQMHDKLLKRIAGGSEPEQLINTLTPSEFEVLHLIGQGHSSQEIAKLLYRSIKTIETHRFNIRVKLNLKDGADLIRYATRWISEEH